jgi:hypothetical protein
VPHLLFLARPTRTLPLDFIAAQSNEGALPFAFFKGWGFFPPWFFSGRINLHHTLLSSRIKHPISRTLSVTGIKRGGGQL